jgi:hypothetical protein
MAARKLSAPQVRALEAELARLRDPERDERPGRWEWRRSAWLSGVRIAREVHADRLEAILDGRLEDL